MPYGVFVFLYTIYKYFRCNSMYVSELLWKHCLPPCGGNDRVCLSLLRGECWNNGRKNGEPPKNYPLSMFTQSEP